MTEVRALWRHPIKGHGREALTSVSVTAGQAMPGDRLWAVALEIARLTEGEWGPCVNFSRGSKTGTIMAINARLDERSETVTLTHPDRPDLCFHPDRDQQAFLDWVRPLMPPGGTQPLRLYRLDERGFTDTDYPSVSLLNLASNADLAAKMGAEVSPLRWRCNIHLDGLAPWAEFDLIGRHLRIGTAEMTVREPIRRCLATTANPATGLRDLDTLGALNRHFDHQDFGIYAEVVKSGEIGIGDRLEVL
ncbi:hypothetical protein SAMN05443999_10594 [Roseovarius azorensis]|uniref:MOSC domain-containing protein n=1 Tax=Roseovarius azorensis TaxID=1287727 RepID=A0A1H7PVI8_9RHOB|nr:MOSC domain-containing protein [Roseovarius azorensis]SEL39414.1 hypothetical protein SAMN05443999_10594 [Roseovarius azorensis]